MFFLFSSQFYNYAIYDHGISVIESNHKKKNCLICVPQWRCNRHPIQFQFQFDALQFQIAIDEEL